MSAPSKSSEGLKILPAVRVSITPGMNTLRKARNPPAWQPQEMEEEAASVKKRLQAPLPMPAWSRLHPATPPRWHLHLCQTPCSTSSCGAWLIPPWWLCSTGQADLVLVSGVGGGFSYQFLARLYSVSLEHGMADLFYKGRE